MNAVTSFAVETAERMIVPTRTGARPAWSWRTPPDDQAWLLQPPVVRISPDFYPDIQLGWKTSSWERITSNALPRLLRRYRSRSLPGATGNEVDNLYSMIGFGRGCYQRFSSCSRCFADPGRFGGRAAITNSASCLRRLLSLKLYQTRTALAEHRR